ncbi:hypothetical protein, partial [Nostoc sp.]|uniref:hypothetical protein n=1 Tax=Nostoc sp. TaxID=1180 RepID=UPI002FF9C365
MASPISISVSSSSKVNSYTGFLQLLKESRVLQGTAPALPVAADGTFSTISKKPAPGNIIELGLTQLAQGDRYFIVFMYYIKSGISRMSCRN